MSQHLYDAHPSMFRMRPFATILVLAIMLVGILVAVLGKGLLPVGLTEQLGGMDERIVKVVGILLFGLSILQLFAWWLSTRSDRLAITEDEVLWTHGLLNKQYTEIGMGSVRTVRVKQSLFQRFMDAGDVSVFTSGDMPELVVRGLPEPNRIRDLVKTRAGTEV